MGVIVKAKAKIAQGSSFSDETDYTSVLADSVGVLFIGDNGIPREVSWTNLRNSLEWEVQTVEVVAENITQTYP